MNTITLYRPVGEKEMILILDAESKCFPPRLDWQPIFYPVLNELYAIEIASKWNTNDEAGNYLGLVTKFDITEKEFKKYKVENVGAAHNNELWIPSEKLNEFNKAMVGKIVVTKVFKGKEFVQSEDERITELINNYEN